MLKSNKVYGFAAAVLVMPALATAAAAHAKLVKESPAHDATVKPPSEISLNFSESIEPGFSSIEIKDAAGAVVKGGALAAAPNDKTSIIMSLTTPLAAGKYTVEWKVLSAGDGHKINGSYTFTAAP